MTIEGVVVLDVTGVLLLVWILNLTRLGRLYVGYGVIFVVAILTTLVTLSVPGLLATVRGGLRILFPTSGLMIVAFCSVALMFVYILTQMTVLSNRLSTLVQELALLRAGEAAGRSAVAAREEGEPRHG
jgi:hypothetical protein